MTGNIADKSHATTKRKALSALKTKLEHIDGLLQIVETEAHALKLKPTTSKRSDDYDYLLEEIKVIKDQVEVSKEILAYITL